MPPILKGKRIVLGVTGSIACYKSLDLASQITQSGGLIDVIMSYGATRFVTPLAFKSLTHRKVITDLYDVDSEFPIDHINIASEADLIVVAPATAQCIAKVALGIADDPLTTTILASRAQIVMAPAMDGYMYENPITQENIEKLKSRGVIILGPDTGRLASGLTGHGRLVDVHELFGHICVILGQNGDLSGNTIVVSAGGTREPLDPARVITNRSSGKMGYAIARAARERGAKTVLVTAPTNIPAPTSVETIKVETAEEMYSEIQKACVNADVLIMAAAVSDYKPIQPSKQKIKKTSAKFSIDLLRNPDILNEMNGKYIRVGFSAETSDVIKNAIAKLRQKRLDLVVANDISKSDSGFDSDNNRVSIIDSDGGQQELPLLSKEDISHRLLDRVLTLLSNK